MNWERTQQCRQSLVILSTAAVLVLGIPSFEHKSIALEAIQSTALPADNPPFNSYSRKYEPHKFTWLIINNYKSTPSIPFECKFDDVSPSWIIHFDVDGSKFAYRHVYMELEPGASFQQLHR